MPLLERGNRHSVTLLEIRLDSDVVVLRGTASEASGAVLKGAVAFCLSEPLGVRGISLRLTGVSRVGSMEPASKSRALKQEKIIYEKEWQFLNFDHDQKKSFTLNAGNYEYPFEHILLGDLMESVEGLDQAYIVYRMKATIERSRFSQDISTKKHLRVVRTLAPGDEALSTTMSVDNIWPDKCQYNISIPAKACVFGTTIPLDITIFPLLKGLTFGTVTTTLKEMYTFSLNERNSKRNDSRLVLTQTFDHGTFEEGENGVEKWYMHAKIELPRSLAKCVQDCEVGPIKVRHRLRISIALHNPDGHMSELRASLPVQLFISPNHLMGDDNEIHSLLPADHSIAEDVSAIPPLYNEHVYDRQLDSLWDEIPNDWNTPLPSGSNTPAILSRNNSLENLHSFTQLRLPNSSLSPPELNVLPRLSRPRSRERPGTSSSSSGATTASSDASTDELQANLAAAGENARANTLVYSTTNESYFSINGRQFGARNAGNTRPSSSNSAVEESSTSRSVPGILLPPVDIAELSRVPSYRTALRVGPRSLTPDSVELPRYTGGRSNTPNSLSPPISPPMSRDPSPHRSMVRRLGITLRSGHSARAHLSSSSTSYGIEVAERSFNIRQAR